MSKKYLYELNQELDPSAISAITSVGTGVATALAINVGSAGAPVVLGGALGTPSSGTLTNATGLPAAGVVGTAAVLGANAFTASQTLGEAADLIVGTTTGTKIGTATGQKIAFWNSTPVVQQVFATGASHTVDELITVLQTLGLVKQA